DIIEEDLVEARVPELIDDGPDNDAGRLHVDQELRHAAVTRFRSVRRPDQRDHVVREVGAAGPELAAIDDPAIAVARRAGADRGEIGPGVGFAHADAERDFAANDPGDDLRRQRIGRVADQERAALSIGDPVRRYRGARREELLEHDVALEGAALPAAESLRPGHADPSTLTELAAELPVAPGPVLGAPGGGIVGEILRDELANFRSQLLAGGRELAGADV